MSETIDNVVPLFGFDMHDIPPAQLLEKAKAWDADHVIVIGETEDGQLLMGGNKCDLKEILWLLTRGLNQANRAEGALTEAAYE